VESIPPGGNRLHDSGELTVHEAHQRQPRFRLEWLFLFWLGGIVSGILILGGLSLTVRRIHGRQNRQILAGGNFYPLLDRRPQVPNT
jgi:hypothetical protein